MQKKIRMLSFIFLAVSLLSCTKEAGPENRTSQGNGSQLSSVPEEPDISEKSGISEESNVSERESDISEESNV